MSDLFVLYLPKHLFELQFIVSVLDIILNSYAFPKQFSTWNFCELHYCDWSLFFNLT